MSDGHDQFWPYKLLFHIAMTRLHGTKTVTFNMPTLYVAMEEAHRSGERISFWKLQTILESQIILVEKKDRRKKRIKPINLQKPNVQILKISWEQREQFLDWYGAIKNYMFWALIRLE